MAAMEEIFPHVYIQVDFGPVSYRYTTMGTHYDDTTKKRNGNKERNSQK